MNNVVNYIRIKSNWFDEIGRKKSVYQRIGYEGLYLYFQMYKFKVNNQKCDDMFITSISFLRKETGYSSLRIFELLKLMKAAKVIKILNVSRWDYLIDENGNVKDKDILQIVANDLPITERKQKTDRLGKLLLKDNEPVMIDSPVTESDFFIPVNLEIFELYKKSKLYGAGTKGENVEKYVALYCLIQKWSNRLEGKMNMRIEKIADVLGIDKDYIHKMIYSLNRNYLLLSVKRRRKDGNGHYFEHVICDSVSNYDDFKKQNKDDCDKLVGKKNGIISTNK